MTALLPPGFLALAAPPGQGGGATAQLVMLALVGAIFYFIVFLPMKKRQKKVETFLAALKVGDKVVTSGGLIGEIAKLDELVLHLQIAPNVRVSVVRTAVVGYLGQPPVASDTQ